MVDETVISRLANHQKVIDWPNSHGMAMKSPLHIDARSFAYRNRAQKRLHYFAGRHFGIEQSEDEAIAIGCGALMVDCAGHSERGAAIRSSNDVRRGLGN